MFQLKVEFKVEKLFRNFWESSPAAVPSATPSFGQSRSHSRGGAAHHVSTKIPKYLGANNIGKNYIICKKTQHPYLSYFNQKGIRSFSVKLFDFCY